MPQPFRPLSRPFFPPLSPKPFPALPSPALLSPITTERPAARRALARLVACGALAVAASISPGAGIDAARADWRVGAEGGTVVRDGGNATRLGVSLVEETRPLTHALRADWLRYGGGNGFHASYVPRWWFDRALYAFGQLEARTDPPLGIDSGVLGIAGVGYRVIDTPTRALGVEAGAGARRTEFEADIAGDADGFTDSEGLVLLRGDFRQRIVDGLRLTVDAEALRGETLGELRAELALAYRVAGGAVRLGYRIRRLDRDGLPTLEDDAPSISFTVGF